MFVGGMGVLINGGCGMISGVCRRVDGMIEVGRDVPGAMASRPDGIAGTVVRRLELPDI